MSNLIIETKDLSKEIAGQKIIDNLNLMIEKGSIYGLMGPNGAGKTTTLKMLLGLIKPTGGTVKILDTNANELPNSTMNFIGYVPDYPQIYPWFKIREILEFGEKIYTNWDREKALRMVDNLGLPLNKRVRSLSKGMKTQVALIMALAINPKLLILDEPTSGLDSAVRKGFLEYVLAEAAEKGTTVLISTHNLHELERVADHIGYLDKGRLIFSKSLEELKSGARRIQAVFPDNFPEEIKKLPEIISIEKQGRVYSIIVEHGFEKVWQELDKYYPQYKESLDLSLEELFISLTDKGVESNAGSIFK